MKLTEIESEVVVLKAVKELIDSIVNFEVLELSRGDPAQIHFQSMTHAKFFNMVLVDLLSKIDKTGFVEPKTYLSSLAEITNKPNFNVDSSVNNLANATQDLRTWLNTQIQREKIWLPSIDREMSIEITRIELVKIGGNICRHNFLRAAGIALDVQKLLARSGVNITIDKAVLVLSDLNEWLHGDMFQYHSSTIAEFLNNIRWGIYTYLQPEFNRSIVIKDVESQAYSYTFPSGIVTDFGKECYWGLMNEVRKEPYMRRFKVTDSLKQRY